jgi:acyl-CoA dehydrogenase
MMKRVTLRGSHMDTLLSLIVLLVIVGGLAFHRVKTPIWTGVLFVVLGVYTFFDILPWYLLIFAWGLYLAIAGCFNSPEFRKKILMKKLFASVKKTLPPMSQTEKEALDAGDVWFEGLLFTGKPDWKTLATMSKATLTKEERDFIDHQVNHLCQKINDWDIVQQREDLPASIWQYLKDEGFFGLCIDKKYGGKAFSPYAHSCIVTQIASRSLSAAVTVMVPNSLGPGELLHHYGTDEQKNYYLPRLAKGEEIPCFGLTGPHAGSDAASITDSGIICKGSFGGTEIVGIRLNFDKRYITLAPVATVMGLAFKLYDPDKLYSDKTDLGITVCLLPTDYPGVEAGLRHIPMRVAFMNGPIRGKDVFIPLDWIIGGEKMIGQGWRMLMECLSVGRGISLPALATAVGKLSYLTTGAYARIRKQFNLPIGRFEGIQEGLARIAGYTYMLDACRIMTANAVSNGIKPSIASAIAKLHMSEISRMVMNDAFDIHAGKAIQMGPNNYLAHGYLGLPISITVEGANILTRNLIIFGQGAMRCHPYIRYEIEAVNDPDVTKGYEKFDKLICQHLGYTVSNFAKTLFYGLTQGAFISVDNKDPLSKYTKALTRMSTAFALLSDVAMMRLGGDLKRKERLSARLGDILSQLYLASTVISYYHRQTPEPQELIYAKWCLETCLYKIQIAFDEFLQNFPSRGLATLLSLTIFPLDRSFKNPPKDKLSADLAETALSPNALRKKMTEYCYIGTQESDPVFHLEKTLEQVLLSEPIEQKILSAIKDKRIVKTAHRAHQLQCAFDAKVISLHEKELLMKTDAMVAKVIAVDEFAKKSVPESELVPA